MNGYLLDTNICVFLFRGMHHIEERLNAVGAHRCFISDVTVAELRYGAYRSGRTEENLAVIDEFVSTVGVVPFADAIDDFAREKARLQSVGLPIEDFDLLIGAAARAAGLTMVTDNVRHFERIEGLAIENWVSR